MEATYRALCKHGYAAVTMEDIAAESEKSKAALHYHYESKHDLLVAFLEDLLSSFTAELDAVEGSSATERFRALVGLFLESEEEESDRRFETAVLEMKAQGPYDEAFRERLDEFDAALSERFADVFAAGVESGEFREDLDVDAAADFVVTVLNGAHTRQVAVERPVEQTRAALERYLDESVRRTAEVEQ